MRLKFKHFLPIFFIFLSFFKTVEGYHGYFPIGYGVRSIGMGGTAVANPQDSLVLATNPAGLSFLESRLDAAITVLHPPRSYSHTLPDKDYVNSQRDIFLIPNVSFSKNYNCIHSFGVGIYGRGVNTTYPRDNVVFGGTTNHVMGVDYLQALICPTYSRKIANKQAIGISLVYGIQRVKVKGLQGLIGLSSSPGHVTNHGYKYAQGVGVRLGWMGEIIPNLPQLKGGIAYSSKVYMTNFKAYKGLIAQHGKLDIPADFLVGFSWQPLNCLLLAFDYQYIFYKDVKALSNKLDTLTPQNLGTNNGSGFGWKNLSVYKFGLNYLIDSIWEARVGYSYGKIPYSKTQVDLNVLSPVVCKHVFTFGTTYHINDSYQVDFGYFYGFPEKRVGQSQIGLGQVMERLTVYKFEFNITRIF